MWWDGNDFCITGPLCGESTELVDSLHKEPVMQSFNEWFPFIKYELIYAGIISTVMHITLHWRHNECDGVSNHPPCDCLLDRLFRLRSKKTSKLCATGLCAVNSPVTGEFPAPMASNVENVSIWWCHHDLWGNVSNSNTRNISKTARTMVEYSHKRIEWFGCLYIYIYTYIYVS